MRINKLEVQVFQTRGEMGSAAATGVADRINELLREQATVNIIFAAAPSQQEFLQALRQAPIEWGRIRAFHMDEYIGLHPDAEQGFGNFLRERLFDKVPLLAVYYIGGDAVDLKKECDRYDALLQKYPPDIVCMGIGENGHIAFNDPPADFEAEEPYIVVELDEACRQQQVGEAWFADISQVPTHAISMSVQQILKAKEILAVVPDTRKAKAVQLCFEGEISPMAPASILRSHPDATIYLDKHSASLLSAATLNRFADEPPLAVNI